MCLVNQSNVFNVILNQVVSQWALKPVLAILLKYTSNQSSIENP